MLKLIPALLLLSALCLSASPASADVAPPDCYEETCTLAVVTASGGDCSSCDNGPAVEDGCIEEMGSSKVKVCQTYGAAVERDAAAGRIQGVEVVAAQSHD